MLGMGPNFGPVEQAKTALPSLSNLQHRKSTIMIANYKDASRF